MGGDYEGTLTVTLVQCGAAVADNGGYGSLQSDAAGVLALPAGFSYVSFGETGEPMTDGTPTPGAHDGMAAFSGPVPGGDRSRVDTGRHIPDHRVLL